MSWVRLSEGYIYVNLERVVKVEFATDAAGLPTTAKLYAAGSGGELVSIGEVSDPEELKKVQKMVVAGSILPKLKPPIRP
jgi:hypothetical protein